MNNEIHALRKQILRLLDEQVLTKPEEQRTQLDNLLLESGRAFTDTLVRLERSEQAPVSRVAPDVTAVLKTYNAINHERALRDADAEAIQTFREPFGR